MDQTELLPEQKIFALKPDRNQQDLMGNFVLSDKMEEKIKIYQSFDGDLKHLSELILIDEYGKIVKIYDQVSVLDHGNDILRDFSNLKN